MFGFRIVCIESAFFASYRLQSLNFTTQLFDTKEIQHIMPPEYRILMYLAPCTIPFLINGLRLWCTTKGLRKYFMKYPQFIIAPCFTPFLFEGPETNDQESGQQLKIWRWGTIVNAIYIGCVPQCILCFTDYYKGVYDWEFDASYTNLEDRILIQENNDAILKSNYGNTIFAATTATFFLILIIFFFGSEELHKERGIHLGCLNIPCCPCTEPCINLTGPDQVPISSTTTTPKTKTQGNIEENTPGKESNVDSEQPQT